MFWKLLPLLIELVRHGGSVLVERYRARRAAEERRKEEAKEPTKSESSSVESKETQTQEK
jgi:hypothetical protein